MGVKNDLFGVPSGPDKQGYTECRFGDDAQRYMPVTGGIGTISNYALTTYRVGDRLIGRATFQNGTPSADPVVINLPPGLHVNRDFILPSQLNVQRSSFGRWYQIAFGTQDIYFSQYAGLLVFDPTSTTSNSLFFAWRSTANIWAQDNGNGFIGNNYFTNIEFDIPIKEWSIE